MQEKETSSKGTLAYTFGISKLAADLRKSYKDIALTLQQELSSHIDGWRGMAKGVSNRAEKMSSSISATGGSIERWTVSVAERLSAKFSSAGSHVGSILTPGNILRKLKGRIRPTRREVTEELSCRTCVPCPVHGTNKVVKEDTQSKED